MPTDPILGRAIELHGLPLPGALDFDLAEVLAALPAEAASLHWRLYDFEAIRQEGAAPDGLPVGGEFRGPGADVEWPDLLALSRAVTQTVWAHLAGARRPEDLPPRWRANDVGREMERFADLLIVAHDATYWALWARDPSWLAAFPDRFSDVRPSDTRIGAL